MGWQPVSARSFVSSCDAAVQVSSLNLLRVIAEQEGVPIEELNAGRVCDWFVKDKERRQQDKESAVLKWDDIPSL